MKFRDEWKWVFPLLAVCALVFVNTGGGEFVYDDTRQIVRNTLIQDNSLIWKALTSDVWAFKADGTQAASNYWRPTFTLWHIINFRLFGLNPTGWHVLNIVLHSGICVMIFALLRRWVFSAAIAFTIALIFSIHPVHVESVAWIAGSPDLLFSFAFLGSLWFAISYRESRKTKYLTLTILLYAAALGAKEIGIVCLPIYYLILSEPRPDEKKAFDYKTPLLMLGGIAAVYFFARWSVLGAISRPPDDAVALGDAILSVPSMFAFYIKQAFFPYWIAVNYPLLPVTQASLTNFVIPLAVSVSVLAIVVFLAKSSRKAMIAAAILLLPLIPAMNATAFISEQMVHDRYLYLPLLGLLMLIVPFATKFISERNLVVAGVVISALLAVQTVFYNAAWKNELALWTWTSKIDNSSFTSMQLGNSLDNAGRTDESIRAFSDAIAKKPAVRGYLGRARVLQKQKKYAEAEADLNKALQMPPERIEAYALYQTYEALGIVYSEQKQYDDAIKLFIKARTDLPIYSAALTEKLAIVLYQSGQKEQAFRELDGARVQARKELLPESKNVFLRLGMLGNELGRKDEALSALREYLSLTSATNDKATLNNRAQAAKLLETLK